MSKTTSDFVEAFKCRRCGKIILNSDDLPERYNEQERPEGEYKDKRPVIEEPGNLEAHTKILQHSRDHHNGKFVDMYNQVDLTHEELETLVSTGESEGVKA